MDKVIEYLFLSSFVIILVSMLINFTRFVKGPNAADRVVSFDAMTITSISMIVYIALFYQRVIYLDVALVYGLLSFIGVIAFARYMEWGL